MNGTKKQREATVYTIHSLPDVKIDTRVRAMAALNKDEARSLTTQIQRTTARLWLLVTEAHDRKAHLALGYETWADYCKAELNMSESRSYQFLDTGHVMKALAGAGVNVEEFSPPPTRVIARIKDRLTDVRRVVAKAGGDTAEIDKALRALAREPRKRAAAASVPPQPNGPEGEPPEETPSQARAGEEMVSCPACAGSGRVTKRVADRLLKVISKI